MKVINKYLKSMAFWAVLGGAVLGFAGCNGNPSATDTSGTSITMSQGNFTETKIVSEAETPLASDCSSTGSVIDTRLKVGDTYSNTYKAINGAKVSKVLNVRARIVSLDKANLKEQVLPLSASGVTVTAGQEEPLSCTIDGQGKGTCVQPDFVMAAGATTNGDYNHCQLSGSKSDVINQRISAGTFKLTSGQSMAAYLITRNTQGNLYCNGRSLGAGEHFETLILSADVPAEGATSACGGTTVFHADAYRTGRKRVMIGSSFERNQVP